MKFCKDCKHFNEWIYVTPVCIHVKVSPPDPVWGIPRFIYCDQARDKNGPCGKDALYFYPIKKLQ